jgi:hypothetical protein
MAQKVLWDVSQILRQSANPSPLLLLKKLHVLTHWLSGAVGPFIHSSLDPIRDIEEGSHVTNNHVMCNVSIYFYPAAAQKVTCLGTAWVLLELLAHSNITHWIMRDIDTGLAASNTRYIVMPQNIMGYVSDFETEY